jgi:DNA-directed RNA polymerase specialized sigma24 family protein
MTRKARGSIAALEERLAGLKAEVKATETAIAEARAKELQAALKGLPTDQVSALVERAKEIGLDRALERLQ